MPFEAPDKDEMQNVTVSVDAAVAAFYLNYMARY